MTNGQYDDALWAMVWAKANGDDSKAKAGYIKHRLSELKSSARQESWARVRALWWDAIRPFPRLPAFWWTLVLLAGLNTIYFFVCYHRDVGTGKVAGIGAALGFNLMPIAAGAVALWFWKHTPQRALIIGAVVLLCVGTAFLLLSIVDTSSHYSDDTQFDYPFNLPDGMPALVASKVRLTEQELRDAIADFNAQWEQHIKDHAAAERAHKVGGIRYWAAQIWSGFRVPYITALCRHVHNDPDNSLIKLKMTKEIMEYEVTTNGF